MIPTSFEIHRTRLDGVTTVKYVGLGPWCCRECGRPLRYLTTNACAGCEPDERARALLLLAVWPPADAIAFEEPGRLVAVTCRDPHNCCELRSRWTEVDVPQRSTSLFGGCVNPSVAHRRVRFEPNVVCWSYLHLHVWAYGPEDLKRFYAIVGTWTQATTDAAIACMFRGYYGYLQKSVSLWLENV